MAREMREHWAIGSGHLAFVAVLNALLAHDAWLAGGWTGPAIRVGKDEQLSALHLVPHEPTQIHVRDDSSGKIGCLPPIQHSRAAAPPRRPPRWPCSSSPYPPVHT